MLSVLPVLSCAMAVKGFSASMPAVARQAEPPSAPPCQGGGGGDGDGFFLSPIAAEERRAILQVWQWQAAQIPPEFLYPYDGEMSEVRKPTTAVTRCPPSLPT